MVTSFLEGKSEKQVFCTCFSLFSFSTKRRLRVVVQMCIRDRFESEEGDAFEQYAKTGADANAFTSFAQTSYLFTVTDHFKESFEILLNLVTKPYFTNETVQKELGIIEQEIEMYQDSPDWQVLFQLLGALYHRFPVIDVYKRQ